MQGDTTFVLPRAQMSVEDSMEMLIKPFSSRLWMGIFGLILLLQGLIYVYQLLIFRYSVRWPLIRITIPNQFDLINPLSTSARVLWLIFAFSVAVLTVSLYQNSLLGWLGNWFH